MSGQELHSTKLEANMKSIILTLSKRSQMLLRLKLAPLGSNAHLPEAAPMR